MNPHDIAQVEDVPAGVAVICACGQRMVRPTLDQAKAAHEHHWGLLMARHALDRRESFGGDAATGATGPRPSMACLDCDHRADDVPGLARHTLESHGRQPTATERTPVA